MPGVARDTIVTFTTSLGSISVEMFNSDTPNTVNNFLSYVNSSTGYNSGGSNGIDNGSFFHRLVSGFVLQGGGYRYDGSNVTTLPQSPPIQNEFNPADLNEAGTIAMARLGGDVNSATNQFFFNLVANPSLDAQQFTAFGRITAGMDVLQAIARTPIYNAGSPFNELPLQNYPGTGPIANNNLIHYSVAVTGVRHIAADFNGDSHSDLLWQNTSGAVSTWSVTGNVNGNQVQQGTFNAAVDPSWHAVETLDLNADRAADMLWRNDNGAVAVWTAGSGGFNTSAYYHAPVSTAWRIAGTGDINGDGRDDIIWQNNDGSVSTWSSSGAGFAENSYFHSSLGAAWKVDGLGDFNGDGKADILWRNTDGSVSTWFSTGTGFSEGSFFQGGIAPSWHIAGVADFTGDGRDDIFWRNDNGAVSLWRSNGNGFDQGVFNSVVATSWKVAGVGDFDNDGKADLIWRNDNGAVSTWESNGSGFDQSIYNSAAPTSWHVVAHEFIL